MQEVFLFRLLSMILRSMGNTQPAEKLLENEDVSDIVGGGHGRKGYFLKTLFFCRGKTVRATQDERKGLPSVLIFGEKGGKRGRGILRTAFIKQKGAVRSLFKEGFWGLV